MFLNLFSSKNSKDLDPDTTTLCGSWVQARYLVVFAGFLVNAVSFVMRVNLSVAIVAISLSGNESKTHRYGPRYDWDAATRGTVLSAYFWGSFISQIPASYVVRRCGPRVTLFLTMLVCTAATFLFVPAAALGWQYACASRVVLGLAQGAIMPACHTILARWAPPYERARMAVYIYSGELFGAVIAFSVSGVLATSHSGWPLVFYTSSVLGLFCAGLWLSLAADSPAQHPLASPQERRYIESNLNGEQHDNQLPVPWCSMLTSPPVIALVITHSAQAWGFWTLVNEIPSYMRGIHKFDLARNGALSSLPYLAMWMTGLAFSWAADSLLKNGIWSVITARKVANSIGHWGSAALLVVLAYWGSNQLIALILLTCAVALNAGILVGFQVNHIDLSPNFAGSLIAVTHCVANIIGTVASLFSATVVQDNEDAAQWRFVFLVAAVIFALGNSVFVIFGAGEVQPWNNIEPKNEKS